jgi:hypothetical protein
VICGFLAVPAISFIGARPNLVILVSCIPDSAPNVASESPRSLPAARSAGQTWTPVVGSGAHRSASGYRVDSRLAGPRAAHVDQLTCTERRAEVAQSGRPQAVLTRRRCAVVVGLLRRKQSRVQSPRSADLGVRSAIGLCDEIPIPHVAGLIWPRWKAPHQGKQVRASRRHGGGLREDSWRCPPHGGSRAHGRSVSALEQSLSSSWPRSWSRSRTRSAGC